MINYNRLSSHLQPVVFYILKAYFRNLAHTKLSKWTASYGICSMIIHYTMYLVYEHLQRGAEEHRPSVQQGERKKRLISLLIIFIAFLTCKEKVISRSTINFGSSWQCSWSADILQINDRKLIFEFDFFFRFITKSIPSFIHSLFVRKQNIFTTTM